MRRNKRCLLAYHRVRADRLEEMCWNGQDLLDQGQPSRPGNSAGPEGASSSSLSPEEEEYVRQYSDMLSAYKGQWTDIDLTGSLEPPRDLFIDVRVLKDAGEIQTEYGYVHKLYLLRQDYAYPAGQCYQLDQEQSILRPSRGCGTAHSPRLFAEAQLTGDAI